MQKYLSKIGTKKSGTGMIGYFLYDVETRSKFLCFGLGFFDLGTSEIWMDNPSKFDSVCHWILTCIQLGTPRMQLSKLTLVRDDFKKKRGMHIRAQNWGELPLLPHVWWVYVLAAVQSLFSTLSLMEPWSQLELSCCTYHMI